MHIALSEINDKFLRYLGVLCTLVVADSTQLRVDELQSALREETTKYKELEGRYTATVGEISKGNGIIAKLQSDLSTLHAKLDSRSAVVVRQEQVRSLGVLHGTVRQAVLLGELNAQ